MITNFIMTAKHDLRGNNGILKKGQSIFFQKEDYSCAPLKDELNRIINDQYGFKINIPDSYFFETKKVYVN